MKEDKPPISICDDKSDLWEGLGLGIVILSFALGIGGCKYLTHKGESLKYQAETERMISVEGLE